MISESTAVEHMTAGMELLPSQFFARNADTPMKRLHAALLEDAVRVYRGGEGVTVRRRAEFKDAERWLFDKTGDYRWALSFDHVVASLGIDADWLRGMLERMPSGPLKIARRAPVLAYNYRRIAYNNRYNKESRRPTAVADSPCVPGNAQVINPVDGSAV